MITLWDKWYAWARCALGRHTWKRARRILGNSGEQRCRYCAATRAVPLKPWRAPKVSGV